jgi:hypothetical protein
MCNNAGIAIEVEKDCPSVFMTRQPTIMTELTPSTSVQSGSGVSTPWDKC